MDIFHLGEELVKRQIRLKNQKTTVAWTSLAIPDSPLKMILGAYLENETGRQHSHQNERPTVLYLFSGSLTITVGHIELALTGGNHLFIAPGQSYEVPPLAVGDVLVSLLLPIDKALLALLPPADDEVTRQQLQLIQQNYGRWHCAAFSDNKVMDSAYITERLICEVVSPTAYAGSRVGHFLNLLLIELLREQVYVATPSQIVSQQVTTADLLHFIEENFDVCTLRSMAQTFDYNPNYLSNRLKAETGQSFIQLVDSQRMRLAVSLLENPQVSIDEIVMYIGYSSKSFFYKKFKARYGQSPTAMRKQLTY